MQLPLRVAMRHIARSAPKVQYLGDEVDTAIETLSNIRAYAQTMTKARDTLRPVVECLRSKALARKHLELDEALVQIPTVTREVEGILITLQDLDRELLLEERRHLALKRTEPQYEPRPKDVRIPRAELKDLRQRITRYGALVERIFDKTFSLDDLGDAGSPDLRAYERLLEKSISWEEMNFPDIDLNPETLAGKLIERVTDASG